MAHRGHGSERHGGKCGPRAGRTGGRFEATAEDVIEAVLATPTLTPLLLLLPHPSLCLFDYTGCT